MKSAVTFARPFLPLAVALLPFSTAPVPAAGFEFAAIGDLPYSETDSLRFPLLRERIDALGLTVDLEVDGGINFETAPQAVEAGADVLVAGTATFKGGASAYAGNIRRLRGP